LLNNTEIKHVFQNPLAVIRKNKLVIRQGTGSASVCVRTKSCRSAFVDRRIHSPHMSLMLTVHSQMTDARHQAFTLALLQTPSCPHMAIKGHSKLQL